MKMKYIHFETLDSTNKWAKENASTLDRTALTVVTASQQTAGKGRLGRHWHSPIGQNIYATFCFFVDPLRKDLGNLPQIMALAAAEILTEEGFEPKLKWPNDLLLRNKKIAGILSEAHSIDSLLFFAIGIGININMTTEDAVMIDRPVTSLFMESGKSYSVESLLQKLANNFQKKLQTFLEKGFPPFLIDYKKQLMHKLHGEMAFRDSQKTWHGFFAGINSDGSLSMELENGDIKTFYSGEFVI